MPLGARSKDQHSSVRAALYLTLLSLGVVCVTGLCTIGIARVAAPTEAGVPISAASARGRRYARTPRRLGGIPQNANSGSNCNAARGKRLLIANTAGFAYVDPDRARRPRA
jgi:hypothetical protein